ncbi:MAG: DUF72 domain-containing protein [Actinobacteria bacterium]|nr:DUF72 domain-containing protein [Actinomycetota bacterium]
MSSHFVGISGWNYPSWRGRFYPKGLPQRAELAYAAEQFPSIELNASFYRLQRPESYRRWVEQTPDGFVFAVKGSRYITHMKRLGSRTAMANFLASGVLALGPRLGPLLWQLPPTMSFDADLLREFASSLPRTTTEAARVARGHDERLQQRSWFAVRRSRPMRHALEVRHESFRTERCYDILREHGVALVISDSAGRFPQLDVDTADFGYIRLHGATQLYTSRYNDQELRGWAERISRWDARGMDAYVYFDNDAHGHAPFDAARLLSMIGSAFSIGRN